MGVILSVNLTGRDRDLEKESDRFLALFNYAREQAELQTREYGVLFDDSGYEFLTYDNRRQQWRSISEDDALGARKLPDGLDLRLTVEARPVVLKRPGRRQGQDPAGDDLLQRRSDHLRGDPRARWRDAQHHRGRG